MIRSSVLAALTAVVLGSVAWAQSGTGLVRHAPMVSGTVQGSLQQMLAESVALNSGADISGNFYVPGQPAIQLNGSPHYSGTLQGEGAATPANYTVTLNDATTLAHVVRRTNALTWPALRPVPAPTTTGSVNVSSAGQPIDWGNLRDLTVKSGVGQVTVPAGTYGSFTANRDAGFTLGVAGETTPSVYNFQSLNLHPGGQFLVVGPVIVNLVDTWSPSGVVGAPANPEWLSLTIRSGGLNLNRGGAVHGCVIAPNGAVTINSNAQLVGGLVADSLTLNGGGLLKLLTTVVPNEAPTVALTAPADGSTYVAPAAITLGATAADADGTVAKVEFFHGATKLGETLTAPYHLDLAGVAAGSYSYRARAEDNSGVTADSAVITVTVTSPNQAPVATAQAVTTMEDSPLTIVLAGSDPEGDALTYEIVTPPAHGTLELLAGNSYRYSPTADSEADDSFTFLVRDGVFASAPATVTIHVVPVNDPPLARPATVTLNADTTAAVVLAAVDLDSTALSFEVVASPSHGALSGTAPHLVYTPDAAYAGPDTFSFKVSDGLSASAPAAIDLTIARVNHPPVVESGTIRTAKGKPVEIVLNVIDIDLGPDAATLACQITSGPQHGSLSGPGPVWVYSPNPGFVGQDAFLFSASDGELTSEPGQVTIAVENTAPVAEGQVVRTTAGTAITIKLTGADADGDSLTYEITRQPKTGRLTPAGGGDFLYTPAAADEGFDSFDFRVSDGERNSASAGVDIVMAAINHAPVAQPAQYVSMDGAPVYITLTGTDEDHDPLDFSVKTNPAHGELSAGDTANTYVYRPESGYSGTDSFQFQAVDRTWRYPMASALATISLQVVPRLVGIDSPVDGFLTNGPTVHVTGPVVAGVTSVRVKWVDATVASGVFSADVPVVEGVNILTAEATDAAGGIGRASVTVTRDTVPPRVTIDSPRAGLTVAGNRVTVTGIVSDAGSGTGNSLPVSVSVNGIPATVADRGYLAADVPLSPGLNTLVATAADRAGNAAAASIAVTYLTGPGPKVQIVSGDNQQGDIGSVLPLPLTVLVTDEHNAPVAGKAVIFRVVENDGLIIGAGRPARAVIIPSDTDGKARIAFKLGTRVGLGNYRVSAVAVGFPVEVLFRATATPAAPALSISDSGNQQSAAPSPPASPPSVAPVVESASNRAPLPEPKRAGVAPADTWTADNGNGTFTNPLFYDEFSDPDLIRVGDDYYLTGTTMHAMPGLPILHSVDLVNWRLLGYAMDRLDLGPEFRLEGGKDIYGQGIWAPSFRHHDGTFHIFSNINHHQTQVFRATNPAGPWTRTEMKRSLHDLSVLFDDDGKAYVIWGYEDIHFGQLNEDLTDLVPGTEKIIIPKGAGIGEGLHWYKIDGKYYILSAWYQTRMRMPAARADRIDGPYEVNLAVSTDEEFGLAQGYRMWKTTPPLEPTPPDPTSSGHMAMHQGGIVRTSSGEWWGFSMMDANSVGRLTCLSPVTWQEGWPYFGLPGNLTRTPRTWVKPDTGRASPPAVPYQRNDDFSGPGLANVWQWNHVPVDEKWSLIERPGFLRLHSLPATDFWSARNTLTQRSIGPVSVPTAELDVAGLQSGDVAGLALLNLPYAWIGVRRDGDTWTIAHHNQLTDRTTTAPLAGRRVWLRAHCDFLSENATFSYSTDGTAFTAIGGDFATVFQLKTFQGVRYSLFHYNTGGAGGGYADFDSFTVAEPHPRGLMRPIPSGQTVIFANHGETQPVKIGGETRFTVVDRGLGRVALQAGDRFVSVETASGKADLGLRAGEPGDSETFQWTETLYGDLNLLSLATHRHVRIDPTDGSLHADSPGPRGDRKDGSCLVWSLAAEGGAH